MTTGTEKLIARTQRVVKLVHRLQMAARSHAEQPANEFRMNDLAEAAVALSEEVRLSQGRKELSDGH